MLYVLQSQTRKKKEKNGSTGIFLCVESKQLTKEKENANVISPLDWNQIYVIE